MTLVVLVAGCGSGEGVHTFHDGGLSFGYPDGWHVTGFSRSVTPPRLAVTSYGVDREAVEGDCGGHAAIAALPPHGAAVLLIDLGAGHSNGSFEVPSGALTLAAGEPGNYECFGSSTRFRLRVGGRALQAFVALGASATRETQQRVLAILASLATA